VWLGHKQGQLVRYFAAVERVLSPSAGLLQIVSGSSDSEAKIAFFPEHNEEELREDLAMAPRCGNLPFLSRFSNHQCSNDQFTKTGSGQTKETLRQKMCFLQPAAGAILPEAVDV
jgi:hypothetical protein